MKNILFLLLVLLTACGQPSSKKLEKKGEASTDGPILAQVDNWRLTLDDFERHVKLLEVSLKDKNIKIDYKFKQDLLNEFVKNVILSQEAIRRGLDKDKDVIKVLENFKTTILSEKIKEDITKDVYVTNAEVENFYNQNKDTLRGTTEFKVREIAVDTLSKANELSVRLLQGEDFSTIASAHSVLPSAKKGGDLGFISYDPDNPDKKFDKFWRVLSGLDEGAISSPFKGSDDKYYIVKLEAKKGGEVIPLAKIRDDLKKLLEEQKKQKKINEFVANIRHKSKIIINTDLLK